MNRILVTRDNAKVRLILGLLGATNRVKGRGVNLNWLKYFIARRHSGRLYEDKETSVKTITRSRPW